jgi:hypothetical protein
MSHTHPAAAHPPRSVQNFQYDGMFLAKREGLAPYTAQFIRWSPDPGMAQCLCSDGCYRLIHVLCLVANADEPPLTQDSFPEQINPLYTWKNGCPIGPAASSYQRGTPTLEEMQ